MCGLVDDEMTFWGSTNSSLFLTAAAARAVCATATRKGRVVWRIEGGIWHRPGFEARLDAIWDSKSDLDTASNNRLASQMIADENEGCDTFVITLEPLGI
ncbi:hypothetical protein [Devosia sp. A16]|uniref:hypothetical protein n=1 Tax=Devosia sp. A16 TaxID=1736675 RepID=UPI0006D83CC7|nr:hypothetical protein [Devosia sp. A16]